MPKSILLRIKKYVKMHKFQKKWQQYNKAHLQYNKAHLKYNKANLQYKIKTRIIKYKAH